MGARRQVTVAAPAFDEQAVAAGIESGGVLLRPDLTTARIDRTHGVATLWLLCDAFDPIARTPLPNDPRGIARRAQEHVRSTGVADAAHFGVDASFYTFESAAAEPVLANANDRRRARYDVAAELARFGLDVRTTTGPEGRTPARPHSRSVAILC